MCGRFIFFTDDDDERIMKIVRDSLPGITGLDNYNPHRGDVYPSQQFPIIHENMGSPEVTDMIWGYEPVTQDSKRLLINARAETVDRKYTFKNDYLNRRCIILATGFYEWSPDKEKYLFTDNSNTLFMGGIYTDTGQNIKDDITDRFVILTKKPDEIVSPIHNRMPVLIPPPLAQNWLNDPYDARNIINNYSVNLKDYRF